MADTVSLVLPDGAAREYPAGSSGADVAASLPRSLARKAVAMAIDGTVRDLADPVADGRVEIVTRDDPRALDLIRHDAAHVMAEAVQELYPGTQVAVGPVIADGFYYDFARETPFTPDDLPKIEKRMREIVARNRPFTKEVWPREKARRTFAGMGETYKVELVDAIPEDEEVKIYRQGDWFDLCRGPHMVSTGQIGAAFRLMKVAGAYWRGDAGNPMLTRIYGTAWTDAAQLDAYLKRLEEAERRDHRRLGREMDLFHFQEEGPGVVFWHARGWRMFRNLVAYMRRRIEEHGYDEVNAPQLLDKALWEMSGHWEWYRENMFVTETEDARVFALKPMNCPGHVHIFKNGLRSYRELPVKLAEFGAVHRYEPSGALHGLMRVRAFTQDDAHVFCTEDQLRAECLRINDLILTTYGDFGFEEIGVRLATRPEKRVGSDAMWDHAEGVLADILEEIASGSGGRRIETGVNAGEGTFYGPKFEYVLRDAIGREWQCGTTQVDFNLPERFRAFYIDSDSQKRQPVMIHRAICGSMERFLGILIENYAGNMPLWFAPAQAVVATVTGEANAYASEVARMFREAGLRVTADLRNEKINYKIREHSLARIPIIAVCGRHEAETGSVNLRRLGSRERTTMPLGEAVSALKLEATPPDVLRKRGQGSDRS